ncbi:MAG: pyruvate formate lyase family protein [Lachnospiraceae bacterium]|nr:pyruvate formate lyase family protein [Lachnospiraceae bacterium]
MITERIAKLEQLSAARGKSGIPSHFTKDYHESAQTLFAACPLWEKLARSMAYAVENQDIYVYEDDRIGGRVYHENELPVENPDPDLDYRTEADQAFLAEFPEGDELRRNQLVGGSAVGHITWFFDRILSLGVTGLRARYEEALLYARDEEAKQFYQGVILMLDSMLAFNDKHIEAYEKLGNFELAERMKKVPRYPAETFREAVQAFFMQHITVMKENPFGGNGPGRLDYYLWPYLDRDLKAGKCTLEEAKEIIDELFLRIDERLCTWDGWVEAIVVGGTNPNGSSAVNPLTYIMIESIIDLDITHPSIYVRLPENPPEDLVKLCARYMTAGKNRAQILYDPAVIGALVKRGTFYRDAVEYACGGCMEVGVQGMTSDFLYIGWQNTAKMLELMITGGICLRTGQKLNSFHADKGLPAYENFESFYQDFIKEADRLTRIYLREQDIYSEYAQKNRPSYLISSMIDDCLERGRNMHGGGARYHDYGGTHLALPNVADGLYAIKQAVFEQKICTAEELIAALKADFAGYEALQKRLQAIPKYGVDNEEADAMATRVASDFADMYLNYRTRWGGKGKPVILTFVYSPEAASILGATADGRNLGKGIAHGVTPHSASMTEGITAAITSCGRMPHDKFAGGASTMWDFDSSWATEPVIEALIKTFIDKNGQIFQGNTTPLSELLDAMEHPEEYPQLIVRVGGYSARFVTLSRALQEDIINRIRHAG